MPNNSSVRVSYRKITDQEIPASYTIANFNAVMLKDGTLQGLIIKGLQDDVNYIIKIQAKRCSTFYLQTSLPDQKKLLPVVVSEAPAPCVPYGSDGTGTQDPGTGTGTTTTATTTTPVAAPATKGRPEIISFVDTDSVFIEYNLARRVRFGPIPSIEVWLWDIDAKKYYKDTSCEILLDAIPPMQTSYTVLPGKHSTGFVTLS